MSHPAVNKYRSGVKHPETSVATSRNTDGTMSVHVVDGQNWRILSHTFPAARETERPMVEQGIENA